MESSITTSIQEINAKLRSLQKAFIRMVGTRSKLDISRVQHSWLMGRVAHGASESMTQSLNLVSPLPLLHFLRLPVVFLFSSLVFVVIVVNSYCWLFLLFFVFGGNQRQRQRQEQDIDS